MSVLNEQIRKLVPGGFRGDRAVQPGQHVVILPGPPAAPAGACFGMPGTHTESFNGSDGEAWGPDLRWINLPLGYGNEPMGTLLSGKAVGVVHPLCGQSPGGDYFNPAYGMPDALLAPDQTVTAVISGVTTNLTAGHPGRPVVQIGLFTRINEVPGPYVDYWSAGVGLLPAGTGANQMFWTVSVGQSGSAGTIANDNAAGPLPSFPFTVEFSTVGSTITLVIDGVTVYTSTGVWTQVDPDCSFAGMVIQTECIDGVSDTPSVDSWQVVAS